MNTKPNLFNANLKNAYSKACSFACEQLAKKDPKKIAENSKAIYDNDKETVSLQFLSKTYQIFCKSGKVVTSNGNVLEDVVLTTLLLHYLTYTKGLPLSGKYIAFSEIPGGGAIYDSSYKKRVINPFIKTFGNDPDLLLNASENLNGEKNSYGDLSVTLYAFPLVPITYVIWKGDEEFPPSGATLFDQSISSCLPVEDIVIMASIATYKLIKHTKQFEKS